MIGQHFRINFNPNGEVVVLKNQAAITNASDSIQFVKLMDKAVSVLWKEGRILSHIDTIYSNADTVTSTVFVSKIYEFDNVRIDPSLFPIIESAGLKNVRWQGRSPNASQLTQYAETLLSYLENNGYPFGKVYFDSIQIDDGKISSILRIKRNAYVPFDKLKVSGPVEIRRGFLNNYLNIKYQQPYNRKAINSLRSRIEDLPYVSLDSLPIIKFANDHAEVQLFLKEERSSRFDFLIGVLPNTVNGQRRFTITGDFTSEMYNKLGHGEYIYAHFQRLRPETQELELKGRYPYVFDFPVGAHGSIGIYRNTTEFRDVIFEGGFNYNLSSRSNIIVSWNRKSSRLLEIDSTALFNSEMLPDKLDVVYNGGKLTYDFSTLDYRFNPSRGFQGTASLSVGNKTILRNRTIESLSTDEIDFITAYDSLQLNTFQVESFINVNYYIPAFNVGAFKIGATAGLKYNEERVYDNELYRIGGNGDLRGFDEQSIMTDYYAYATAEFRLFLDRNSYLSFPFVDYGFTRVNIDDQRRYDPVLGVGIGLNFATPAGIFNVSFAAGKRLDNPLDFGNTKIHFGYVNLF